MIAVQVAATIQTSQSLGIALEAQDTLLCRTIPSRDASGGTAAGGLLSRAMVTRRAQSFGGSAGDREAAARI